MHSETEAKKWFLSLGSLRIQSARRVDLQNQSLKTGKSVYLLLFVMHTPPPLGDWVIETRNKEQGTFDVLHLSRVRKMWKRRHHNVLSIRSLLFAARNTTESGAWLFDLPIRIMQGFHRFIPSDCFNAAPKNDEPGLIWPDPNAKQRNTHFLTV